MLHIYSNPSLTVIDGDINLDTRLNRDTGNLLDNIRRSVQVDQTLVDAHLEAIPSVGTLSRRSLTGGDSQDLGRHTDGSTDMELLVQRGLLEVGTDLFQVLDIAGGQGDADAVDNLVGGRSAGFFLRREGHGVCVYYFRLEQSEKLDCSQGGNVMLTIAGVKIDVHNKKSERRRRPKGLLLAMVRARRCGWKKWRVRFLPLTALLSGSLGCRTDTSRCSLAPCSVSSFPGEFIRD
jgi:hypothetical protein